MELPTLLRELKEGDYFFLDGQKHKLLQFLKDGAFCRTETGILVFISNLEIIELLK